MPLQLRVPKEVYPFNFPIESDGNNGKDFPMFRDGEFYSTVRFLILSVMVKFGATRSPRINPDLGSGRSISYEAQFKHALLQIETGRKIADSPVLRDKLGISRGNVPDGEWTLPGIYKKNYFPRHKTRSWEGINKK